MSEETRAIVAEVERGEVTVGQLLTVAAMYEPDHHDPYLDHIREALDILQPQEHAAA